MSYASKKKKKQKCEERELEKKLVKAEELLSTCENEELKQNGQRREKKVHHTSSTWKNAIVKKHVKRLIREDGSTTSDSKEILNTEKQFYENLYMSRQIKPENTRELKAIFIQFKNS